MAAAHCGRRSQHKPNSRAEHGKALTAAAGRLLCICSEGGGSRRECTALGRHSMVIREAARLQLLQVCMSLKQSLSQKFIAAACAGCCAWSLPATGARLLPRCCPRCHRHTIPHRYRPNNENVRTVTCPHGAQFTHLRTCHQVKGQFTCVGWLQLGFMVSQMPAAGKKPAGPVTTPCRPASMC